MSKKILTISLGFVAVLAFAFVVAPQKASANGYLGSCNTNCYYPRPYYYQYQYPTANCACFLRDGWNRGTKQSSSILPNSYTLEVHLHYVLQA